MSFETPPQENTIASFAQKENKMLERASNGNLVTVLKHMIPNLTKSMESR